MSYLLQSLRSAASGLAALLLVAQLAGCVVFLADHDAADEGDFAEFLGVDAGCDDHDWWILSASVTHPAGVTSVVDVWVEVWLVYYDEFDDQFFDDFLGSIQLYLLDGTDWNAELPPGDTFLDCYYPGEYMFRFFAEDFDGDLASVDMISPPL
jgi:hypothetical protein